MRKVELSVDWFVGEAVFPIIPVCGSWGKNQNNKSNPPRILGWVLGLVQVPLRRRVSLLCRVLWVTALGSSKRRLWFGGTSPRALFSCWEFAWAMCLLIWFCFLISALGLQCHSSLLYIAVCVHLNIKLIKRFVDEFFFSMKSYQSTQGGPNKSAVPCLKHVCSAKTESSTLQFSQICGTSPGVFLSIAFVCTLQRNKSNLHSWWLMLCHW